MHLWLPKLEQNNKGTAVEGKMAYLTIHGVHGMIGLQCKSERLCRRDSSRLSIVAQSNRGETRNGFRQMREPEAASYRLLTVSFDLHSSLPEAHSKDRGLGVKMRSLERIGKR